MEMQRYIDELNDDAKQNMLGGGDGLFKPSTQSEKSKYLLGIFAVILALSVIMVLSLAVGAANQMDEEVKQVQGWAAFGCAMVAVASAAGLIYEYNAKPTSLTAK